MSTIAAPADRRFRRAHVKPARKRRGWRALVKPLVGYGVAGLAFVFGVYRGSTLLARAHVLQIDHVVVSGNDRMSRGEVLAVLTGLTGESLLSTDLNRWRKRLLASPWVRDAALRRSLPSTVEVVVWERRPVAIGRLDGDMYLIDERGVLIDQYGPQYAELDLPIVDGLVASSSAGGTLTDEARADMATRVIASLGARPEIAKRLSQIDVNDVRNVSVILSGDPAVIELGDDQFLPRLESYLQLASTLRERVPDIDYVDLRFDDRIYVRPAGSVAKASRNARPADADRADTADRTDKTDRMKPGKESAKKTRR